MLPELKCLDHSKDIVLININKNSLGRSRLYCVSCIQLDQQIQIKKVLEKLGVYYNQIDNEIEEDNGLPISKMQRLIKSCTTIKFKIEQVLQELIDSANYVLEEILISKENEQNKYRNITSDITNSKLEEIAYLLSGNIQRESKVDFFKSKIAQYGQSLGTKLKSVVCLERDLYQEYKYIDEIKLKNQLIQSRIVNSSWWSWKRYYNLEIRRRVQSC